MNSSKLALTISAVVLVHLVAGTVILLQPGCKSDAPAATPAPAPAEAANTTVAPPENTTTLSEPTRPADLTPTTPEPTGNLSTNESLTGNDQVNATGPAPTASTVTYEVKRGDSLSKIAKAQKVSLADLMAANNLTRSSKLKVGQTLTIPTSSSPAPASTEASPAATSTESTATASGSTYTVKSGDSLSKIAHQNGTTVSALRAANHLTSDKLKIGQTLQLPSGATPSTGTATASLLSAPTAPEASTGEAGIYVVQSGDSLDRIAKKEGVKVSELIALNNISNPTKLKIGQKLKLPSGAKTAGGSAETPASSTTPPATEPPPAAPLPSVTTTAPPASNETAPPPAGNGTVEENVPVTPVTPTN
ncbi:MAG: LysM peptidoglycan-binding domain-containing protein [Opitutales bacterium]